MLILFIKIPEKSSLIKATFLPAPLLLGHSHRGITFYADRLLPAIIRNFSLLAQRVLYIYDANQNPLFLINHNPSRRTACLVHDLASLIELLHFSL